VKKALFGLAKSEGEASSIVDQLKVAGFSAHDISALIPDRGETRHLPMSNIPKRQLAPRLVAATG
jgi:hypothetical protein